MRNYCRELLGTETDEAKKLTFLFTYVILLLAIYIILNSSNALSEILTIWETFGN